MKLEFHKKSLEEIIRKIQDPKLAAACEQVLKDERFLICPAALNFHHTYEGGLLVHTVEVAWGAMGAMHFGSASFSVDVLLAACIWHDYAKIWEYEKILVGGRFVWEKTDYLQKVGHISGSSAAFYAAAVNHGVRRYTIVAVQHAILAHHGPVREWGSPVAPQSMEALLLHQADMLSAKFGSTKDRP